MPIQLSHTAPRNISIGATSSVRPPNGHTFSISFRVCSRSSLQVSRFCLRPLSICVALLGIVRQKAQAQISSLRPSHPMSSYSPYANAESGPPEWKPGEEDAATAFLALTFWLILEVNVGIYRVFKKKNGLCYWNLTIGIWGSA